MSVMFYTIFIVGKQAYLDYGWLGMLIGGAASAPLAWLIPFAGWFFLPKVQMITLTFLLGMLLLTAIAEGKAEIATDPALKALKK